MPSSRAEVVRGLTCAFAELASRWQGERQPTGGVCGRPSDAARVLARHRVPLCHRGRDRCRRACAHRSCHGWPRRLRRRSRRPIRGKRALSPLAGIGAVQVGAPAHRPQHDLRFHRRRMHSVALVILHGALAWVTLAIAWTGAAAGVAFSLGWVDAPRALHRGQLSPPRVGRRRHASPSARRVDDHPTPAPRRRRTAVLGRGVRLRHATP